jgi:hypothetical protein
MTNEEQKELLKEFWDFSWKDGNITLQFKNPYGIVNEFIDRRKNKAMTERIFKTVWFCVDKIIENKSYIFLDGTRVNPPDVVKMSINQLIKDLNKEFNLNIPEK